jgi:hypothetical protein
MSTLIHRIAGCVACVAEGTGVLQAQQVELSLVTDAAVPGVAAVDFRQVLNPSVAGDAWLAGELRDCTTDLGATFRLVTDVHPQDPNFADFVVPDRDGEGASPAERMTTFLNVPTASPSVAGRFGLSRAPDPLAPPGALLGPLAIDAVGAFEFPTVAGLAGYWARVSVHVPESLAIYPLYVAEQQQPGTLVFARGVLAWSTNSSVAQPPTVRETPWVLGVILPTACPGDVDGDLDVDIDDLLLVLGGFGVGSGGDADGDGDTDLDDVLQVLGTLGANC